MSMDSSAEERALPALEIRLQQIQIGAGLPGRNNEPKRKQFMQGPAANTLCEELHGSLPVQGSVNSAEQRKRDRPEVQSCGCLENPHKGLFDPIFLPRWIFVEVMDDRKKSHRGSALNKNRAR